MATAITYKIDEGAPITLREMLLRGLSCTMEWCSYDVPLTSYKFEPSSHYVEHLEECRRELARLVLR